MSAATFAFVVAVLAFIAFGVVLVLAFLPYIQRITAAVTL